MIKKSNTFKPSIKSLAAVSVFLWLMISLYGSAGFIVAVGNEDAIGNGNPLPLFLLVFGHNLIFNLPWLLIAPAIAYLARRCPLNQGPLLKNSIAHVAFFMVVILSGAIYKLSIIKLFNPASAIELRAFFQTILLHIDAEILLYTVVLAGYYIIEYYRKQGHESLKRTRLLRTLNRERLNHFRNHMQPLFLDNTLRDIEYLIHTEPKMAEKMIADLARLVRQLLKNSEKDKLDFESELNILEMYIRILSVRTGKRIVIKTDQIKNGSVDSTTFSPCLISAIEEFYRTDMELLGSLHTLSFSTENGQNGSVLAIELRDVFVQNYNIPDVVKRSLREKDLNGFMNSQNPLNGYKADFGTSPSGAVVISIDKYELSTGQDG